MPPAYTVRVCDSIACEMAGAADLLRACPEASARTCVLSALHRALRTARAVIGQNPLPFATPRRSPIW